MHSLKENINDFMYIRETCQTDRGNTSQLECSPQYMSHGDILAETLADKLEPRIACKRACLLIWTKYVNNYYENVNY